MSKNITRIFSKLSAIGRAGTRNLRVEVSEEAAKFNSQRLEGVFDKMAAGMIRQDIKSNDTKRLSQVIESLQNKNSQENNSQENNSSIVSQSNFEISSLTSSFQQDVIKGYLKMVESEPDGRPTIVGNMNNSKRKKIFIAENIKFDFDFAAGNFSVSNLEQMQKDYEEIFNGVNSESDFKFYINNFFDAMGSAFSSMYGLAGAPLADHKYYSPDQAMEKFFYILSKVKSKSNVYKSKIIEVEGNKEIHLVNSPHRHDSTKNFGDKFLKSFSESFIISSIIEDAAKKAYGDNYGNFFSQLKFAPQVGDTAFLRDQSVCVDGVFYQTDSRVAIEMAKMKYTPHELLRLESHAADLKLSQFTVEQSVPFDAKGGNVIFTKSSEGKKVLIAAVSDAYYSDEGEFQGGYMINDSGRLVGNFNMLFGLIDKYSIFRESIKKWGKEIGCDEVIVLDRNMEGAYKNKFKQLYHLDIFCGALPRGFVVVNREAITDENFSELSQVFGEDKIISMSQEEHQEMCANFIVFDNLVLMSSPKTPQSFVKKLNDYGFDVYVPGVYLSYPDTLKAGWPAGVRCMTSSYNGLQQEKSKDGGGLESPSASRVIEANSENKGVVIAL